MLQRIKNVQPQSGRRLLVEFENGEKKHYDIRGAAAQWEAFWALLTDKELFAQVQVDTGGYGISWNEDLELSCHELYQNGVDAE
ncbi:DUF2442 domain-containing protein [Acidaminococcus sp. NSJ-142]|jgi:hypothetical protein|uniref:DUF2442 domain-containing protein n=1 Tax=Acidaminococcus TaxID=904 RepID=UPI000CF920D6|nr:MULTISPECIES: DUF2442 domain-containing protein [Acidaminococcus]MCD2435334.1 DUF2442 domain-containing protein [Acidaminococcus hominis]MCH4096698.1 DUF2442 domain-containing protein [Acidaminococcus provencensis]